MSGRVTVPVNVGEASGAFKSRAVWVAVETGFAASVVLSTDPSPTIVLLMPLTVPVKVGEAKLAFRSRAVCCAVETGLAVSAVLSTEPNPTIVAVTPETVPVNVGEARGALAARSAESLTQEEPFHLRMSPDAADVIATSKRSFK